VGIFFETLHCHKAGRGAILSPSAANEQLLEDLGPFRPPICVQNALQEAFGPCQPGKFQDLRAMSMTKNKRSQAAIPHQDMRNLSCPAWFSLPRGAFNNKNRRDLARIRRISHGIARAIENLQSSPKCSVDSHSLYVAVRGVRMISCLGGKAVPSLGQL